MKSGIRVVLWLLYLFLGFESGLRVFWIQTSLRSYNVNISLISAYLYIPYIPWCLKFIPWMCSSRFGFRGYHRKPHLLLGLFGCAMTCIPLSFKISLELFLFCFFSFHWWAVWAWVNIAGSLIEDTLLMTEEEKLFYQQMVLLIEAIGSLLGVRFGGPLWEALPGHNTGPVIGGIYGFLFFTVLLFFKDYGVTREGVLAYYTGDEPDLPVRGKQLPIPIGEELKIETNTLPRQWASMRELIANPYLKGILIYNLVYSLFPSYDTAFWYMQQEILGFTPNEMSILGSIGEAGKIAALILFYFTGTRIRINCYYIALGLLTVITSIPPLLLTWSITYSDNDKVYLYDSFGLDPMLLVLGRNVFGDFFDKLHALPTHQLASMLCRTANSAGGLAAIGSLHNFIIGLGRIVDSLFYKAFGVDNQSYEGLKWLVLLRICLDLASSLFTFSLPNISISKVVKRDAKSRAQVVQTVVGDEFDLVPETTSNAVTQETAAQSL